MSEEGGFQEYLALVSGALQVPSWMVSFLPVGAPEPAVRDVVGSLDLLGLDVAGMSISAEPQREGACWEVSLESTDPERPEKVTLWAERARKLDRFHLQWGGLTPSDKALVRASEWSVGVSMTFGAKVLSDYHQQLKVLAAAAPDAVAFVDVDAGWLRPAAWLFDAAAAKVPPSPSNLYCIHSVYDEERPTGVWLHTHGLLRCGSIELEMIEVPRDHASSLGALINTVAAMFVDRRMPAPDTPFEAGRGLSVLWLPWQVAIGEVKRPFLGGLGDRDEHHGHPAGVLFAPKKKFLGLFGSAYQSAACYVPQLDENPLLYVSSIETERMGLLATERISKFLALQARFKDADEWVFLAKLGYPIEGGNGEQREHLWFEVHSAQGYTVDATLTNEPYGISTMHEGDRARHSLEWTSNWLVLCPHGRYDPDTIVHLERTLDSGS